MSRIDRRSFLRGLGIGTAALGALGIGGAASSASASTRANAGKSRHEIQVRNVRERINKRSEAAGFPKHRSNGEESDYPYVANFSKSFQHDALGEVDPGVYQLYLEAIKAGTQNAWENLPLAGVKKLKNPLAGLTLQSEGLDSQQYVLLPAPRIDSAEGSAELCELYWQALCRDVAFNDYPNDPNVSAAASEISIFSGFKGPRINGEVSPATVFRGNTPGDLSGPYISQLLFKDLYQGSMQHDQRQRTVPSGVDYLTDYDQWLFVQNGFKPGPENFEPTKRYIRNGRDLAVYVHEDMIVQPFYHAALVLLHALAPTDPGNPYNNSSTMLPFATFDYPHLHGLVAEVSYRALRAVWFQKWHVHRRARPEAIGGRLHNMLTGRAQYPLHSDIFSSVAPGQVFSQTGTYLLPQAYPEGAPTHPAYASGHATVAGACATILKAWFDESARFEDPVVPNSDGTSLESYTGHDAGEMTVGGEINKLAFNIAMGRNFAGIHWRTDAYGGLKIGEELAISILREQRLLYREKFSFTLTKFDGTTITIFNK